MAGPEFGVLLMGGPYDCRRVVVRGGDEIQFPDEPTLCWPVLNTPGPVVRTEIEVHVYRRDVGQRNIFWYAGSVLK